MSEKKKTLVEYLFAHPEFFNLVQV